LLATAIILQGNGIFAATTMTKIKFDKVAAASIQAAMIGLNGRTRRRPVPVPRRLPDLNLRFLI
jgi:hypothetical protein